MNTEAIRKKLKHYERSKYFVTPDIDFVPYKSPTDIAMDFLKALDTIDALKGNIELANKIIQEKDKQIERLKARFKEFDLTEI